VWGGGGGGGGGGGIDGVRVVSMETIEDLVEDSTKDPHYQQA